MADAAESQEQSSPQLKVVTKWDDPRIKGILDDLRAYMDTRQMSLRTLSHEAGINPSTISMLLSHKYKSTGKLDGLIDEIEKFLVGRRRAEEQTETFEGDPEFVMTPTARAIIRAFEYAHFFAEISLVHSAPGIGKTWAADYYRAKNRSVWKVTMMEDCRTISAMLAEIGDALGFRFSQHGTAAREQRVEICRKIAGSKGLLIIDEAQHLSPMCLDQIRSMKEASGVGCCIMGADEIYSRTTATPKLAQLYSRVGMRVSLSEVRLADVEAVLDKLGVSGRPERTFLREVGARPGGLRGVSNTVKLAKQSASGAGEKLSIDHIRDAWTTRGAFA